MAHMNLDPNQIFAPLRPLFSLAGSVMICAGILSAVLFSSGLELAVAGFLMKAV